MKKEGDLMTDNDKIRKILSEYDMKKMINDKNIVLEDKKVIVGNSDKGFSEIDIDKDAKNIFMKNNSLIQTKYDLTSLENKVYLFLSDRLKRVNIQGETKIVKFRKNELGVFIPKKKDLQVNRLTRIFSNLRKKSIYIKSVNEEGNEYWGEYGFINSYKYVPRTDEFEVSMDVKISELIVEHYLSNGGYTPVNLDVIYQLKSVYSQRIYELLRLHSWKGHKISYTLDELKAYLRLDTKKSYNLYSNVKNTVLEPAIQELNETGVLEVRYEEDKIRKKVIGIDFYVNDLENRRYFSNSKNKDLKVAKSRQNDELDIDISVFTKGALKLFEYDFNNINFKDKNYMDIFMQSVAKTMDKDNVDVIGVNSYTYFKGVLTGMLNDYDYQCGMEYAQENFFTR